MKHRGSSPALVMRMRRLPTVRRGSGASGSEPEPARPPGRAELLLLGGRRARRVVSLRLRRGPAEEVHFDLADEPAPELGIADAPPSVRLRCLSAREGRGDV